MEETKPSWVCLCTNDTKYNGLGDWESQLVPKVTTYVPSGKFPYKRLKEVAPAVTHGINPKRASFSWHPVSLSALVIKD